MSYLLWSRDGQARIASPRLVLRAAEVPLLRDAQALRDALEALHGEQQARVDAACADGRASGHAQGLADGKRDAAEQVATTLTRLAGSSAQERDRLRGEVGALALQVVRKLLGSFAPDEVLAALAATAARDLLATQPVALVVHPDQVDAVAQRLADALGCEVRGDPALAPDACRLETEHGAVDASLSAQLERLETAWQGRNA